MRLAEIHRRSLHYRIWAAWRTAHNRPVDKPVGRCRYWMTVVFAPLIMTGLGLLLGALTALFLMAMVEDARQRYIFGSYGVAFACGCALSKMKLWQRWKATPLHAWFASRCQQVSFVD